jgi:hypothetical protein
MTAKLSGFGVTPWESESKNRTSTVPLQLEVYIKSCGANLICTRRLQSNTSPALQSIPFKLDRFLKTGLKIGYKFYVWYKIQA